LEIREYLSVVWKRKVVIFVSALVALFSGFFINYVVLDPVYRATARILVEQPPRVIMLTEKTSHIPSPLSVETQKRLLKSIPVAESAAERLGYQNPKEAGITLMNQIIAQSDEDTGIIQVSMEGTNPIECEKKVNAYADAFQEISKNYMEKSTQETIDYLKKQLEVAENNLVEKEKKIYEFNQKYGIVTLDQEMTEDNDLLISYEKLKLDSQIEYEMTRTQLENLRSTFNETRQRIGQGNSSLSGGLDNTIQKLTQDVVNLEVERETLLNKYKESHPRIQEMDEQINNLKAQIENHMTKVLADGFVDISDYENKKSEIFDLEARVQILHERISYLDRIIAEKRKDQMKYPKLQYEFTRLAREKEIAEELFVLLYEQHQQAEIDRIKRDIKINVFERARAPEKPIRPNRKKNITVFTILGLMIGVGLAFLLEEMEETIRTSDDVKNHLNLPVLGSIPYSSETINKLITDVALKSPIAEAYRRLSFFTQLFCLDPPIKTLLITSSKSDEGKSTTLANLAISMAQEGTKVLMVDTDLRRPMLHRMFGVDNSLGISSILTGELEAEIAVSDLSVSGHLPKDSFMEVIVDRLIQPVSIKGLSVIPSGPLPANSVELLRSERMLAFLRCVEKKADIIIFDSPPAIHVIDAVVLSQVLDGVLLIVNSGRINKDEALQVKYMIESTKTPIIGVALNNIETSSPDYYYYYYYGGYGYGSRQRRKRVKLKR